MGQKYTISVPAETVNAGNWNKIGAIKAIRILTQLGLKEAKDMVEAAVGSSVPMEVTASTLDAASAMQDLRNSGVIVRPAGPNTRQLVLDSIREMAILSTVSGEYALAGRINQFLYEENERG
jgi:hypothetical protein